LFCLFFLDSVVCVGSASLEITCTFWTIWWFSVSNKTNSSESARNSVTQQIHQVISERATLWHQSRDNRKAIRIVIFMCVFFRNVHKRKGPTAHKQAFEEYWLSSVAHDRGNCILGTKTSCSESISDLGRK
jgi:hypothetical protein